VELLVVDDRSDDPATLEALDRLAAGGVRVVRRERNGGPGESRNTILAEVEAPLLFNLDADDLAVPGRLAEMADRLDADPHAAVCYGDYEEFGVHGSLRGVPSWLDPFRLLWISEYPPCAMWRRSALAETGGWPVAPQSGAIYEDWCLWADFARDGRHAVYLGRGVVSYRRRLHGDSQLARIRRRHLAAYRDMLRRHPELLRDVRRNRRSTDVPLGRQLLYPLLYGPRPRFGFERRLRFRLDRAGVRTSTR
jgi:glycosyltransferase involved in cell wall biosynthesis